MEQTSLVPPDPKNRSSLRRVLGFLAFGLQIQMLKVQYIEFLIADGLSESEAQVTASSLEVWFRICLLCVGVLLVGTGWVLRMAQSHAVATFLGAMTMYTGLAFLLLQVLRNKQPIEPCDISAWLRSVCKRKQ